MHGGPVHLLYVDDDVSFTELVSTFFAEERPSFEVETGGARFEIRGVDTA